MINKFQTDLRGIATGLIARVMDKLDDDPETKDLFLEWARGFSQLEPFNAELWNKLRTHIQWPI